MSVVGEYLHWCIVVVFVAQLLWSLHQDDSSQVVAKQEAKEVTDKRGEEAAPAEGSQMSLLSRVFCEANYPCIAESKIQEVA